MQEHDGQGPRFPRDRFRVRLCVSSCHENRCPVVFCHAVVRKQRCGPATIAMGDPILAPLMQAVLAFGRFLAESKQDFCRLLQGQILGQDIGRGPSEKHRIDLAAVHQPGHRAQAVSVSITRASGASMQRADSRSRFLPAASAHTRISCRLQAPCIAARPCFARASNNRRSMGRPRRIHNLRARRAFGRR